MKADPGAGFAAPGGRIDYALENVRLTPLFELPATAPMSVAYEP
jgi:hypothetical protein